MTAQRARECLTRDSSPTVPIEECSGSCVLHHRPVDRRVFEVFIIVEEGPECLSPVNRIEPSAVPEGIPHSIRVVH